MAAAAATAFLLFPAPPRGALPRARRASAPRRRGRGRAAGCRCGVAGGRGAPLHFRAPELALGAGPGRALVLRQHVAVRPGQTDYSGAMHHGAYVGLLEAARADLLAALGLSYAEVVARLGVELVVVALQLRYRAPARLGDVLRLDTHVERRGARLLARSAVARVAGPPDAAPAPVADAEVQLACVDAATASPRRRWPLQLERALARVQDERERLLAQERLLARERGRAEEGERRAVEEAGEKAVRERWDATF